MNWEILTEPFMLRALVTGIFFAVSCGLLGVFLILRRTALIGEGLSHFSFGIVGLALCLGIMPMTLAVPMAVVGALLVLELSRHGRRYGDAAIGMLSAAGVAMGLILANVGDGFSTDLNSYLFGDILTVSNFETLVAAGVSIAVFILLLLFSNELFTTTFDPDYAQSAGISATRLNQLLAILTGLTVVVGIKVMGMLLVSSMIIFPAVTALESARSFRTVLVCAALYALMSVVAGIAAAFALDLPPGATIVAASCLLYGMVKVFPAGK